MARRILVIEDNEDIALVVKTTLMLRQYEVLTASDGVKGIELARSQQPLDLIILDVLLPELDGYQVLRRLKSDPATAATPVALFSAHMSDAERREAINLGAVAVLVKPFEPRQLNRDVGALLENPR